MNFYDVLAAEKLGGGIPTTNFFDLLFAQYMGSGEQWQTYEGTLPATLNANGDDMQQYQIWGNVGGVGDRTVNLLDKRNIESNMYVRGEGAKGGDDKWDIYYVTATNGEQYIATGVSTINSSAYIGYADANKNILGIVGTALGTTPQTVTMPEIGTFLAVSVRKSATTPMLTPGTTPPETFAPFGYEVDMIVSDGTNTTTTPIYIGDDPLDKDEYIDYQAEKIYRMIGGTLTPTDPPVPLPALPTCEGTTIVDYAGQSVAPENVVLEYAKRGS